MGEIFQDSMTLKAPSMPVLPQQGMVQPEMSFLIRTS